MICLLDTMIVSYFLEAGYEQDLAEAASRFPMAVVEDVRRELRNHRTRGGKAFDKWFAASHIEVRDIALGSPASATLTQLSRPDGVGERASIALAASDPSLTFVTHDSAALILAVREIWMSGERVLGLAAFLRRLFEGRVLGDPDAAHEIMSLAYKGAAQWPTWWATWRAEVAAGSAPNTNDAPGE